MGMELLTATPLEEEGLTAFTDRLIAEAQCVIERRFASALNAEVERVRDYVHLWSEEKGRECPEWPADRVEETVSSFEARVVRLAWERFLNDGPHDNDADVVGAVCMLDAWKTVRGEFALSQAETDRMWSRIAQETEGGAR